MAAPIITILNNSEVTVASWDAGTVQADKDSSVLTLRIWNNKGNNTTPVSDLKDCSITTLDTDGGTSSDVVAQKWVRINVPEVDGNSTTWTAIGGGDVKYIRADGISSTAGYVIQGTTNDGTLTNSKPNYCTVSLKVHVPLNATPGTKVWKTRLNGYYV